MPGNTGDGAADRLLQVLGHPPVVLLLEVADSNDPVTGSDGKLVLGGRPAHESGGSADSKKDESWFIAFRGRFPNDSVTVLRACDNAPTVRGNINTSDCLVVALERVLQLKSAANLAIELDRSIPSDSQGRLIGRKGVVGDGVVEEVVNFGGAHDDGICNRRSSLLSLKFD